MADKISEVTLLSCRNKVVDGIIGSCLASFTRSGRSNIESERSVVYDVRYLRLIAECARNCGFLAADRSRICRSAHSADELYYSGEKDETDDDHRTL